MERVAERSRRNASHSFSPVCHCCSGYHIWHPWLQTFSPTPTVTQAIMPTSSLDLLFSSLFVRLFFGGKGVCFIASAVLFIRQAEQLFYCQQEHNFIAWDEGFNPRLTGSCFGTVTL